MKRLKQGDPVVFECYGVNRIGFIEKVQTINKTKRYWIRDEAGKLHPPIGINTQAPGRILTDLTEMYFAKNEVDANGKIIEWDEDETDGITIGSEGMSDEPSTK